MTAHRIAVIPGDGIGKEVVPEGLRVLEAVERGFDVAFEYEHLDWSSDYYLEHGSMMPADWKAANRRSRRHLLRRHRLAGVGAGSRLALGHADHAAA